MTAADGKRWRIGTGRDSGLMVSFFKANAYDPFYTKDAVFTPGPDLGYGGVVRVLLNPVDFKLFGPAMEEPLPEETELDKDGTA